MTSAGMAVVVFLVCFTVFVFTYWPVNKQGESFTINPFPRVVTSSPYASLINKLKTVAEQILFYKKALSIGQKITLNLSLQKSVVLAGSLSAYEEMISDIEKKTGNRPVEKKIFLKIESSEYLVHSSFFSNGVLFLYRPRIVLTDSGNILRDHIDVAKAVLMALKGEEVDIDLRQSSEELLSSLMLLSYRYGIEVVKNR
ncbi:MAG TPA: hypothetical protein PLP64_08770 [Pseudothermotoga sp.]|nr:hypothetical protein [Pseudothermotoga sp.]HOK84300.1 hypothetical protein [Pseudothermotoga sp.]HPP70866.1 hypothetical protein [Pseudothermotoga sp.]